MIKKEENTASSQAGSQEQVSGVSIKKIEVR